MRDGTNGYPSNWCIHYDAGPGGGKRPDACRAGVAYDTLPKPFKERPCFLDDKGCSKPGTVACDRIRRPTADEIATYEAYMEAYLNKTLGAIKAIEPWRKKHRGTNHQEVVECPSCKGRLHLSIAAINSHVHASCETKDCISWME